MIRKKLILNKNDYFVTHLSLINNLLPVKMTKKEIEVMAAFLSLEGDISKEPFGTTARRIVKEKLNLSSGGLGNYLDTFNKRGFIINNQILPILRPDKDSQEYSLKIIHNESNS